VELRGLRGNSKRPGKLRAPKQLRERKLFQKYKLPPFPSRKSTFKLKLFFGGHTHFSEIPSENKLRSKFLRKQSAQQVSQKSNSAQQVSQKTKYAGSPAPANVFAIYGQRRQLCINMYITLH
jgi:hypothetical protein